MRCSRRTNRPPCLHRRTLVERRLLATPLLVAVDDPWLRDWIQWARSIVDDAAHAEAGYAN